MAFGRGVRRSVARWGTMGGGRRVRGGGGRGRGHGRSGRRGGGVRGRCRRARRRGGPFVVDADWNEGGN